MPELPEVETIVQQLRKRRVEGRKILGVEVFWAPTVEPLSVTDFSRRIVGTRIEGISRYGKWMLFTLSSGKTLMVHLRMAGSFSMEQGTHDRLVVKLSDKQTLYYRDSRKFGRWKLVDNPQVILARLGPDALTRRFSFNYFETQLKHRSRMIKPLLLDQSVIAGLGNIYVDEALWKAQMHPQRSSNSLTSDEAATLFKAIKHVLRVGVKNRGTSLGVGKTNYRDVDGEAGGHRGRVKAYGRAGMPCERCAEPLQKIFVAQRGTTFCPNCQNI